jgi:hypothetical protein
MPGIVAAAIGVGLPVFPCRLDKRPACPRGFKDAAISAAAIGELWRRFPGPLIGVPTGAASGLFVLDIDPAGIDWLDMVCRDGRLTATRVHQTRRGGFHLIYRLPKTPLPNSAAKLARGVDTRGEGGYAIWPPSPGYLLVDESPPAAVPRWLERKLREPRADDPSQQPSPGRLAALHKPGFGGGDRPEREARRGDALARFVAASREGERNQRLFWAACRAAELDLPNLSARLIAAAQQSGLGRLEAQRTVASALRTTGPRRTA